MAAGGYDRVVAFMDAQGEFVLAQIFPDIFDGVEFGRIGRQVNQRDVWRDHEGARDMPSGAIQEQCGVTGLCDAARDFGQMLIEGFGVGIGHDDAGPDLTLGADRAEDIGGSGALVTWRARTRAALLLR